ncbi:MAG TPA: DivIVA domain-containing protein [Conexibacter sp.]
MTHEPPEERLELQDTQPHEVVPTDDLAPDAQRAEIEATSAMDDATSNGIGKAPGDTGDATNNAIREAPGDADDATINATRLAPNSRDHGTIGTLGENVEDRPDLAPTRSLDRLSASDALVAAGTAIERSDAAEPGADPEIEALREIDFPLSFRGYDTHAVDDYVARVERCIARFDEARSPSAAVRIALDRVGEQTAAILHEAERAAEETTSRSRAQADDRLQRAEQEASAAWVAAQARVRSFDEDIERLWEERQRLIESTRDLSKSLIGIADAAEARFPPAEDDPATPGSPSRPGRNGARTEPPDPDTTPDSLLDPD